MHMLLILKHGNSHFDDKFLNTNLFHFFFLYSTNYLNVEIYNIYIHHVKKFNSLYIMHIYVLYNINKYIY